MKEKDQNKDLEVVKVGFANGVAEGFPLTDKEKNIHLVEFPYMYNKTIQLCGIYLKKIMNTMKNQSLDL